MEPGSESGLTPSPGSSLTPVSGRPVLDLVRPRLSSAPAASVWQVPWAWVRVQENSYREQAQRLAAAAHRPSGAPGHAHWASLCPASPSVKQALSGPALGTTPAGVDRALGTGVVVVRPVTAREAAGPAVGTGARHTQRPHGRVLPCALSCLQAGCWAPQGEGLPARVACPWRACPALEANWTQLLALTFPHRGCPRAGPTPVALGSP